MIYFNNDIESNILEGYINPTNKGFKCPDILVQKGKRFFLYNKVIFNQVFINYLSSYNSDSYFISSNLCLFLLYKYFKLFKF